MPRRPAITKPIEKKLSLDAELVAKVELMLFSDLEGRVPYGAWAGFIEQLLREHFVRKARQEDFAIRLEAAKALASADTEAGHRNADLLMAEELTALGYDLNAFNTMRKHYA
jgi:hypothetical protein